VQYRLDGVCEESPARAIGMTVFSRGPAPEVFNTAEGELPEKLSAALPAGHKVCSSHQLVGVPGNIQGDLAMEFRLVGPCAGSAGSAVMLYLSEGGWVSVFPEKISAEGEPPLFWVTVPQSTHYVIAVKE